MADQNKIYTSTVVDQEPFTSVSEGNNKKLSELLLSVKSEGQPNTVKVYVKFATDTDIKSGGLLIDKKYYLGSNGTVGKITDE